jgi:hypothetical protein
MVKADIVFYVPWYKLGKREEGRAWQINVAGPGNVLELMDELHIPKGIDGRTAYSQGRVHQQGIRPGQRAKSGFPKRTVQKAHPGKKHQPAGPDALLMAQRADDLRGDGTRSAIGSVFTYRVCWGNDHLARGCSTQDRMSRNPFTPRVPLMRSVEFR